MLYPAEPKIMGNIIPFLESWHDRHTQKEPSLYIPFLPLQIIRATFLVVNQPQLLAYISSSSMYLGPLRWPGLTAVEVFVPCLERLQEHSGIEEAIWLYY